MKALFIPFPKWSVTFLQLLWFQSYGFCFKSVQGEDRAIFCVQRKYFPSIFFVNTKPIIQSGVAFGKNLPTVPVTHFGHLVYFQRQNGPNVLKKHVTSILGRFLSNFSYPVFSANKFISDTQCLHECWDVCRISVFNNK